MVQHDGSAVYLYSHGGGTEECIRALAEAFADHPGRASDEAYFARAIFCRMVKDDLMGETGFGIATYPPDEESCNPLVIVNCGGSTVTIGEWQGTFHDFEEQWESLIAKQERRELAQ